MFEMAIYTFYVKYCERGHPKYSLSPVTAARCGQCGKPLVTACRKCGTPAPETFQSGVLFGTHDPSDPPTPPLNCEKCGRAYPWNSLPRRMTRNVSQGLRLIWREFKGLSKLHLTIILLIILLLIGVLTWQDIVTLLNRLID